MTPFSQRSPASVNYRLLRIASEKFGRPPSALDPQQTQQVENIAAREYMLEQAVLSSQEAKDVHVPDSQVHAAAEQIADRYVDEQSFEDALQDNGLTPAALKSALERELRVEAVLGLVGSQAPPLDDTEIDLFYYMNRERLQQPERRRCRHILITINDQFAENTREAAWQRLGLIEKRLQKNPQRFAEQALKHSECPTALQGGLLGDVEQGQLYSELDQVLFHLRANTMSSIVESPSGLHLLLCEDIYAAGIPELADIYPKLKQQLQEKQQSRFTRRWIQQLLNSHSEAAVEQPSAQPGY